MTGRELTDAIGRAHALCLAEIRAAKYEYDGGRRKLDGSPHPRERQP